MIQRGLAAELAILFVWTFMVFDIVKREKHETLLFVFPA